jgi:hypothetical protein
MAQDTYECLRDCIADYGSIKPLFLPGVGSNGDYSRRNNVMSPFVTVDFMGGGGNLTVGNKSSPDVDNHAIIKSFECGTSDGMACSIEIFDEEGGKFQQVFRRLTKKMTNIDDYKMKIDFGWLMTDCNGQTSKWGTSQSIYMLPFQIEVNYIQGKIKYLVTGNDVMNGSFNTRYTKPLGDDKYSKLSLKDAIRKLCKDEDPKINVEFKKKGAEEEWDFKGDPKDSWKTNNEDKLSIIRRWIRPYRTIDDKGIIITWNNTEEKPTLILWEDPGEEWGKPIGTFIVNGGKCSNVLEFSPKYNFTIGMATKSVGGYSGGATSGGPVDIKKDITKEKTTEGILKAITVPSHVINTEGTKDAGKQVATSEEANSKANAASEQLNQVDAEMRIHGNPSLKLCSIIEMLNARVAIVVINPFHLFGGEGECGKWLAKPMCNDILSSKDWMIMGVSHSIREGSFTTTLKLYLPARSIPI